MYIIYSDLSHSLPFYLLLPPATPYLSYIHFFFVLLCEALSLTGATCVTMGMELPNGAGLT